MSDKREKIAMLLALATSPVEAEAKAALLKARELMAKYKLSMDDVAQAEESKVVDKEIGLSSTTQSTPWAVSLASTIAKHYSCKSYITREWGKKTVQIGLVGLEDDFRICRLAILYAHDCVVSRCDRIKKQHRGSHSAEDIRQMCHSYGWGFYNGLRAAFDAQTEEHPEWGLALAVPKAVSDALACMETKTVTYAKPDRQKWNGQFGAQGYADGQKFDMSHRLEAPERRDA